MKTLVSVIVTHHLNINDCYLKQALEGLSWQRTNFKYEVVVITSAPEVLVDVFAYNNDNMQIKLVHDVTLDNATKKFAHFYKIKSPSSKLLLLHSDDVVMAGHALQNMVMAQQSVDLPIIQNPLCNGDIPSKYITPIVLSVNGKLELVPQHYEHEYLTDERKLALQHIPSRELLLCPFNWVAFYCTMIPTDVFEMLGELDEKLDCKNNDVDFCYRASRKNIPVMVNFGALALHAGSKTFNHTKTKEMEQAADAAFTSKYSASNS